MPAYQALADRLLARLTDRAIAVSASTRDFLVRQRHVPADRVRLIWNGAPLDEFAPAASADALALRRALGLPAASPVVGIVGRINAQKGHRYLIDAAPAVVAAVPGVRFLVVGDGDLLEPAKRQAAERGVADRFVFAGHRADIPVVLSTLDVFCIASTYEGTPLVLFEAMAAGKAIVSTAVDGCREVLEDGVTGRLVPPRDPDALAGAVIELLRDAGLRERLAESARRVSARYDIRACVREMERVYEELLEGSRAT
jgi:glycosyltransferase involved in cell wall biosynthesis